MKYFIVYYGVVDGEYEYLQQTPVKAESLDKAIELALQDGRDWVKNDHREVEFCSVREIAGEEWKVIARHMY